MFCLFCFIQGAFWHLRDNKQAEKLRFHGKGSKRDERYIGQRKYVVQYKEDRNGK